MDQEEENKQRLKAIRELMYAKNEPNEELKSDVLELTEDDLYDEHQDNVQDNLRKKNLVNQNLTLKNYYRKIEHSEESLLDSENASKSVAALKNLISKLEKTTEELSKPNRAATIEEAVKDSLKPYLKEWLNEYLYGIVQNIVDKEVKNIVLKNDKKNT